MATKNQSPLKTVRQVKHVERKRRSQNSLLKPISPAPDSPTKHAHSSEDASDGYVDLSQVQNKTESYTPPPYRMPPYPLYNSSENTPLATPVALPGSSQTAANPPTGLQTHSNKFPIEREVILSSNDKNRKIPILHDYSRNKMHNSGVVGPDIPVKQMQAWSTQPHIVLSPDQAHPVGDNPTMYKAVYHPPASVGHDYQMPIPQTGAVPRSGTLYMGGGGDPTKPAPRPFTNENTIVQIDSSKDNKKTMTKTYHTIKDIISNKFKTSNSNNKEDIVKNKEKEQIVELNNVEDFNKKMHQQYQYQQQQLLAHQAQQQYYQQQQKQQCRPIEQDQQYKMQQMYLASRSQEMLSRPPPTEELYYQTPQSTPQRPPMHKRPPPNLPSTPVQYNSPQNPILRSPQQIERESLKKQCEARRSASQPHLSLDDDDPLKNLQDSRPQPQVDNRRSSYGNIMEFDKHKDTDDGGFLGQKQRISEDTPKNKDELQGTPRKRLEGEIGRIEGVYNVAQRGSKNNDNLESKTSIKASSAASSDYEHKTGEQSSSNFDSGRGSAAYSSSGHRGENSAPSFQKNYLSKGINDSNEWVDLVENEIQNILDPKMHDLSLQNGGGANSTISESISSMTPPLPPLSPGDDSSNNPTPRNSTRLKHSSLPYGSKPNYESFANKNHPLRNGNASKNRFSKKVDHSLLMRGSGKHLFGLDTTDLTSTTTRSMDLESMLDCQSDSDENLSIQDARTIRKQLEGLESMYGEVLKILGVKKHQQTLKYEPSNPKLNKRRYGSMSSLPSSSISSRPIRDKRRSHDDRKKVRDMRGINKRFQRLESHVVTLARSVAHLSSEMRTQHIMITEIENIRGEISTLRTQTNMLTVRAQNNSRNVNVNMNNKELPELANPSRVKKLTKFFGDEPPLLRLFLRKLGYEKYANLFENEKIGMVELPYLTEERLLKMGVPLGPRLRIMQEAQISVCKENTLCIV